MNLLFLDEDSLLELKSNLPEIVDKFTLPDNTWIEDFLGRFPFLTSRISVDEFSLDMSQEKPFLTEFENVKSVYSTLHFLSDTQASNEKLWAGLCLTMFWNYTQYRWGIAEKCSQKDIEQHFFFGFGPRRSLTRNAASRLWWIGRLTYDENREDSFELTKFVCENSDYIMHVLERNTSNNKMIVKAFLSAVITARNEGIPINTGNVGALSKYLNILGGTYILDCLPEEVIYDKILRKARTYSE